MKPSTIHSLPLDIKIEVKRRLREGRQAQLDITEWLNKLGYPITKSALNRYAINLRNEDKHLGLDREFLALKGSDIVALFEELSHLKLREAEILEQIRMAMLPQTTME